MNDDASQSHQPDPISHAVQQLNDVFDNEIRSFTCSVDKQLREVGKATGAINTLIAPRHEVSSELKDMHDSLSKNLGTRPPKQGSVERKLEEIKQILSK